MRTAEVAARLGLTAHQVMDLVRGHAIQVPKDGDRYNWSEAIIEELRAALRHRQALREESSPRGLTAKQAALELGLSYDELLRTVQQHRIPVQRIGPHRRLDFDDAALALVRKALEQPPPPPPPAPRGLTTKEVAQALGVSYEVLVSVLGPLRKNLPVTKEAGHLYWSGDAVRIVREALTRRHLQQWLGEAEDHAQAVRKLGMLGAGLQNLATDTKKLKELLSRKPAETGFIHTVPGGTHCLSAPIGVLLIPVAGAGFQASLAELSLATEARTRQEALRLMRQRLWVRYLEVSAAPDSAPGGVDRPAAAHPASVGGGASSTAAWAEQKRGPRLLQAAFS